MSISRKSPFFVTFVLTLMIGLSTLPIQESKAFALVHDSSAMLQLVDQLEAMREQYDLLVEQYTALLDIKNIGLEDLMVTQDIMDTLGVADSFFTENMAVLDELDSLVSTFDVESIIGDFMGPLENISGLVEYRSNQLFSSVESILGIPQYFEEQFTGLGNVDGMTGIDDPFSGIVDQFTGIGEQWANIGPGEFTGFGDLSLEMQEALSDGYLSPLEQLRLMSEEQMQAAGGDVMGATASAWNSQIMGTASQSMQEIQNFEERSEELNNLAEEASTLQEQEAVNNQVNILQADQNTYNLATQQQGGLAAAAYREASLQIQRETQIKDSADSLLKAIQ